jgi:hypothetical protein
MGSHHPAIIAAAHDKKNQINGVIAGMLLSLTM